MSNRRRLRSHTTGSGRFVARYCRDWRCPLCPGGRLHMEGNTIGVRHDETCPAIVPLPGEDPLQHAMRLTAAARLGGAQ